MDSFRSQDSLWAAPVFLALITAVGCGGSDDFLSVSGAITYDGQPLTNGSIGFVRRNAEPAKRIGTTIAVDGRYEIPSHEGLEAGTYQVLIYSERPSGRKLEADEGSNEMVDERVQFIPAIYNSQTTLSVEITSSRDDLDFTLEKPKQSSRRR